MTGTSMKCWCTIPMPSAIASSGEAMSTRCAVHDDLALVRGGQPVEDVHQRRLAGAVLAEERVHLAALQVEPDVVGRDDAGVPLRDPAQLQHGLPRRAWRRRRRVLRQRAAHDVTVGITYCVGIGDLAVDDLLLQGIHLVEDVLRDLRADLAEGHAVVREVEGRVLAALERAVLDRLDRVEHRGVHALHGAGEDVRTEVGLVAVHADAPDALVLRPPRGRRGRSRRPPGRRPASPWRSGRARAPCTAPAGRTPGSSPSGP